MLQITTFPSLLEMVLKDWGDPNHRRQDRAGLACSPGFGNTEGPNITVERPFCSV